MFNHVSYRLSYNLRFGAAVAMQICGMHGNVIAKGLPFNVHISALSTFSLLSKSLMVPRLCT